MKRRRRIRCGWNPTHRFPVQLSISIFRFSGPPDQMTVEISIRIGATPQIQYLSWVRNHAFLGVYATTIQMTHFLRLMLPQNHLLWPAFVVAGQWHDLQRRGHRPSVVRIAGLWTLLQQLLSEKDHRRNTTWNLLRSTLYSYYCIEHSGQSPKRKQSAADCTGGVCTYCMHLLIEPSYQVPYYCLAAWGPCAWSIIHQFSPNNPPPRIYLLHTR